MRRNEARGALICPCHDVTVGDIEDAIAHGHTDPETIKRATAVYMGACQGKFCSPLVQRLLAARGVERSGEQRRPAARLPVVPVPLGALVVPDPTGPEAERPEAESLEAESPGSEPSGPASELPGPAAAGRQSGEAR